MCSIHSISRYNDFVLDLQDSSEVHSYQPVMNKVVSCKDSSSSAINDLCSVTISSTLSKATVESHQQIKEAG